VGRLALLDWTVYQFEHLVDVFGELANRDLYDSFSISLSHCWEPFNILLLNFIIDIELQPSVIGLTLLLQNVEIVQIVPEEVLGNVFLKGRTSPLHLHRKLGTTGLDMLQM